MKEVVALSIFTMFIITRFARLTSISISCIMYAIGCSITIAYKALHPKVCISLFWCQDKERYECQASYDP